jgi:alkyldihydroxyacetonephosphate synthase
VGGRAPERYDAAWRAGLGAALAAGANLSHHHGVGRSKVARLAAELGQGTELLHRLRKGWDPAGLFNPGALSAPFRAEPAVSCDVRDALVLDQSSQLAEVEAGLSLGAVEALLSARGFTLGLRGVVDWSTTVAGWIGHGFPGAKDAFDDPVASRVAGFEATAGGVQARVRAAPRRATGPDLLALFAGTRAEIGVVERVSLAVSPRGAAEPRIEPFSWDRDPPLNAGEARAFALVRRALRPA